MSDRQRRLLRELGGEIRAIVRGHVSRSAQEREDAHKRWAALNERTDVPPGDDFRADLNTTLTGAVERLQALHDKVVVDDDEVPSPRRDERR